MTNLKNCFNDEEILVFNCLSNSKEMKQKKQSFHTQVSAQ